MNMVLVKLREQSEDNWGIKKGMIVYVLAIMMELFRMNNIVLLIGIF